MLQMKVYRPTARAAWKVPGVGIVIVHSGKIIHSRGYGVRRQDGNGLVDENTFSLSRQGDPDLTASVCSNKTAASRPMRSSDHLLIFG
jgi:hypothetical protein